MCQHHISRRNFLAGIGLAGMTALLDMPVMSFASAPTDKRLMVVILRGAMDGLAAVPPVADPNYHAARGALALPDAALLPLDGNFAMNAAAPQLQALFRQKQLLILHACASPYRERSHFEAQDLLENGSPKPHGLTTGWLGRTVDALGGQAQGLAIGPTVPLVLQGAHKVESWAPSNLPGVNQDFLNRIQYMYKSDPALSQALAEAEGMQGGASAMGSAGPRQFIGMMKTAASFMIKPDGARIATIDIAGWDTHANQGTGKGRFAQALGILSEGVDAFRTGMGPEWDKTAVLMITEFGRTVAANGSGGSDHGTATAAFLAGGRVQGGRVIGNWPGLAQNQLYQNRDLYPDNDIRSLIKAVLAQHLAIPGGIIDQTIFPQSGTVGAYKGLFS
jgi:uncharacterized protein (DUF1501 family)